MAAVAVLFDVGGHRLCQFDQLSRWLGRRGLAAGELTEARAAEFASVRRKVGLVTWTSPKSVALPLEYLREIGVMPPPAVAVADGPLEELLAGYRRYLLIERRLSEHTVFDAYVPAARLLLTGREGPEGLALERLSPADVSTFLIAECPRRSVNLAAGDERIPLLTASADVVIARNSLDHVDDPELALVEMCRILRAGGTLILMFDVDHAPTAAEPHSLTIARVRAALGRIAGYPPGAHRRIVRRWRQPGNHRRRANLGRFRVR